MRLFRDEATPEADVRPTLLGVVTLLFLLLFFLMSTSSGQRLGVVDLRLAAPGQTPPLPHSGLVKSVRVTVDERAATVEFEVATTDIGAASTTRELRRIEVPERGAALDEVALTAAITTVHEIDRSQEQVEVVPGPAVTTATLLSVIDIVRGPADGARFPKVSLR
ncbi:MAG: hypothetical protein EXR71_03105 [Myxococcales bacterium]|nr:hypothetical protein [Myxococcales bacterium]